MKNINYDYIAKAIDFYKKSGFEYIDVPWIVSLDSIKFTLPQDRNSISCNFGELVGSAEQSFIEMFTNNKLSPGRYVAATPCFRDDVVDKYHNKYFFKVELIDFWIDKKFNETNYKVESLEDFAMSCFNHLTNYELNFVRKFTSDGVDIELDGIELGSYGHRCYNQYHWAYGTGLAEPRFSIVTSN